MTDNSPAVQAPPVLATQMTQSTAVEATRAVAEVKAAIMVAQEFPRDEREVERAMRVECSRLALANKAFYSVPNRGSGPSIHLARELARIFRNVDYGVRELARDDDAGTSEIQAFAWDQQTNVRSTRTFVVPHVRMARGKRSPLTDVSDIYLNNQNIGARAVRECIFAVMPTWFVEQAQDLCHQTLANGEGEPLEQRIPKMVAAFDGLGVTVARLEAKLGKPRTSWTGVDLARASVLYGSLSRGEVKVEDEFPEQVVTAEALGVSS